MQLTTYYSKSFLAVGIEQLSLEVVTLVCVDHIHNIHTLIPIDLLINLKAILKKLPFELATLLSCFMYVIAIPFLLIITLDCHCANRSMLVQH